MHDLLTTPPPNCTIFFPKSKPLRLCTLNPNVGSTTMVQQIPTRVTSTSKPSLARPPLPLCHLCTPATTIHHFLYVWSEVFWICVVEGSIGKGWGEEGLWRGRVKGSRCFDLGWSDRWGRVWLDLKGRGGVTGKGRKDCQAKNWKYNSIVVQCIAKSYFCCTRDEKNENMIYIVHCTT